ncbi:MlaE family ABC transporter permease [Catalinimonas niigatensis]|uniref:MlaE family ABC transporter permease n=1 Tax=Catalinimonas niigatensis TaxID=1397264 RepID=UPI0026653E97|nr:ABC transporter permease [Catalinimonas niigatensis]WPP50901.1 ABC transporter permease [Catalinimonas niigatensis]
MRSLGKYVIFIGTLFKKMETLGTYVKRTLDEAIVIGINSLVLVTIVSTFIGAVTTVQTAENLVSPFIQDFIISTVVRDMTVFELAPTITSIVLAGKVGSSIAGELGTMRITEQVDALEVMGINSASYLVLPKIVAAMLMFPMLCVLAGFLSIYGGFLVGTLTNIVSGEDYVYGLRFDFRQYFIFIALVKSLVFAFLVSSIASYKGFFTKGGALEVGQASTSAVTNSCIAILLADYMVVEILL